jgi:hypothetical protein
MRLHMSRPHRAGESLPTLAAAGAILAVPALPAAAAPLGWSTAPSGANSNGVGLWVSQVARLLEISVGASGAGAFIRGIATSSPGAV